MATMNDTLNPPPAPARVFYSTGRMLGVEDFRADQDYHRGRLARALVQLYGTGTVSGLLVQTDANKDPAKLEIQVTPGLAIDRIGRIIEVPRIVCIVLQNWLSQQVQAWKDQSANPQPGVQQLPDPNLAIQDTKNLMCDVFATFVPCTRGVTPCFASQDDYDATDAFSPNRWLDSFAMQLVLRTDANPKTPVDPWKGTGAIPAAGANVTAPTIKVLQGVLLANTPPPASPVECPPGFDTTSVFLARILIPAVRDPVNGPKWDLSAFTNANIDNNSRLFLYPAALLARLIGLGSGTQS